MDICRLKYFCTYKQLLQVLSNYFSAIKLNVEGMKRIISLFFGGSISIVIQVIKDMAIYY